MEEELKDAVAELGAPVLGQLRGHRHDRDVPIGVVGNTQRGVPLKEGLEQSYLLDPGVGMVKIRWRSVWEGAREIRCGERSFITANRILAPSPTFP